MGCVFLARKTGNLGRRGRHEIQGSWELRELLQLMMVLYTKHDVVVLDDGCWSRELWPIISQGRRLDGLRQRNAFISASDKLHQLHKGHIVHHLEWHKGKVQWQGDDLVPSTQRYRVHEGQITRTRGDE